MPKRSKIVSGKVIAAVAKSKTTVVVDKTMPEIETVNATETSVETAIETAAETTVSITPAPAPTGDVRDRFQQKLGEMKQQRHADDPRNVRRVEKRRKAEAKKQQPHQKRPSELTSGDLKATVPDAKKPKTKNSEETHDTVMAEEGSLVFGNLKGPEETRKAPRKAISNPKQALQKLQAEKDKLAKLKETDADKAAILEDKLSINKAINRARGVKVKDDATRLKKSVQHRERQKEKSRQLWADRKTELTETREKKQAKRSENIQARIDAKIAKKRGIKVKSTSKGGKGKGMKVKKSTKAPHKSDKASFKSGKSSFKSDKASFKSGKSSFKSGKSSHKKS